jgi:hypothetical protein
MPKKNPVLNPKAFPKIGKSRYAYGFTLSGDANWMLDRICKATGRTRSGAIEGLLLPSYSLLFERFLEGASFASIIVETHYAPDVVRQARREYDAGWKEPEPVILRALDKRLQIKELEVDQAMIERTSEERVERLRADTEKRRLDQELRIERTRAVANGGSKR